MARIRGNNGADDIGGTSRADRIFGRSGDDVLDGKRGNDKIFGEAGFDQLFGRSGRDKLFGGADDDILFGHGGKDKLKGGAGNDQLYGGKAKDKLFGEDGNDQLYGGKAKDKLFGGNGDDLLSGDGGNDRVFGGAGNDTVAFSGNRADYDVIAVAGGFQIVHARGAQADGIDFLSSDLEFVQFGDVFININNLLTPPGPGPGPNTAPVAGDDAAAVAENGLLSGLSVLANDTDADGNALTVAAVNGNAAAIGTQIALVSGALLTVNANGTYTYNPNGAFDGLVAGQTAIDSFTYTVSDGNGGSDVATVSITINGVGTGGPGNDAPVASNDMGAVSEDGLLNGASVLANDTDADPGDTLVVAAVNGNATAVGTQIALASGALLTLNADGTYAYDPNGAFNGLQVGETGSDSFQYTVSDGHGGTDVGTVNITVNGVNDEPVVAADALVEVNLLGAVLGLLHVQVAPDIEITDPDDEFMEGARVAITSGYQAGNDQLIFQDQNGITGNFDAATGVLTLTGHATEEQYEQALDSVEFGLNILDLLTLGLLTGDREITYQVDDGDGLSAPETASKGLIDVVLLP